MCKCVLKIRLEMQSKRLYPLPMTFTNTCKKCYKHCWRYFQEQAQILFRALLQMLLTNAEMKFQSSLQILNTSIIANSLITSKQALLQLSANTVAVNDANTVTSESRRFLSKSKLTPLTFDWGGCLCSDTFQGMWLWRWSSLDIWTNFHEFD